MEPNIRIKRYAKTSKQFKKPRRRRGVLGSVLLVLLILFVAALALSLLLAPLSERQEREREVARKKEPERGSSVETTRQTSSAATGAAADSAKRVVQSLSVTPSLVTPTSKTGSFPGLSESLAITVKMVRPASLRVAVVDPFGSQLALLHEGWLDAGDHVYEWDAKYANGEPLASGNYFARAQVEASNTAAQPPVKKPFSAVSFITEGRRSYKTVALTIEDGSGEPDQSIVTLLKKKRIRATAFVGAAGLENNPGLIRGLKAARVELGARYDPDWPEDGSVSREEQMTRLRRISRWLRLPRSSIDSSRLQLARAKGFRVVEWSIDAEDIEGDPQERAEQTVSLIRNGSIIRVRLSGDEAYDYIEGLARLISARGYRLVTMSTLLSTARLDQNDIPSPEPFIRSLRLPAYRGLSELR